MIDNHMKAHTQENDRLLNYLYEHYYEEPERTENNPYTSSHWRYYSKFFDVQFDDKKRVKGITGVGFGQCKWNSFSHRVLDEICILSYLIQLPGRSEIYQLKRKAGRICRKMDLDPTFDVFRQVCSLHLLSSYITTETIMGKLLILIIGDGYGVLSALLKERYPEATIILADLGKTLLVQALNLQRAYPQMSHELISAADENTEADFLYCPADAITKLEKLRFNVAVNIASMQEMNANTIKAYFELLRKSMQENNIFYCCNRQSKTLVDGEKSEIHCYPWSLNDIVLLDEYCPWQKYFVSRAKSENGPTFLNIRIPFINYYDGKTIHKIVVIDKDHRA